MYVPWPGNCKHSLITENPSETINFCKGNIESEDKYCNESLKELRQKNLNRPIIAQLNTNSIRNEFQFLKKGVCANLDILRISETKLDDLFPSAQFLLDGFSKTGTRMVMEFSSTFGMIFHHAFFQIQIKLKVFLLRLISGEKNG